MIINKSHTYLPSDRLLDDMIAANQDDRYDIVIILDWDDDDLLVETGEIGIYDRRLLHLRVIKPNDSFDLVMNVAKRLNHVRSTISKIMEIDKKVKNYKPSAPSGYMMKMRDSRGCNRKFRASKGEVNDMMNSDKFDKEVKAHYDAILKELA